MTQITAFNPLAFRNFSSNGRCVNRIYRSAHSDVMIVCWEPNQASSYHDHATSESIVYVLEGCLTVVNEKQESCYGVGEIVVTSEGVKHQLRNDQNFRLVTLHVYTPCLEGTVSEPLYDFTTVLPEEERAL